MDACVCTLSLWLSHFFVHLLISACCHVNWISRSFFSLLNRNFALCALYANLAACCLLVNQTTRQNFTCSFQFQKFEIQKRNCSASDLIGFWLELHAVVRSGYLKFMTFDKRRKKKPYERGPENGGLFRTFRKIKCNGDSLWFAILFVPIFIVIRNFLELCSTKEFS